MPTHSSRLIAVLLLACALLSRAQQAASDEQLMKEERWSELVERLSGVEQRSADQEYEYGIGLAALKRWEEAREAFLRGASLQPHDKRFPVELAGVAYKQQDHRRAIAYLHRALRLDPRDEYANDFLASLYFLRGNLEAAVRYWNRVNQPQLTELRSDPPLHLQPAIFDHALAFAAASVLKLDQLRVSDARLRNLDVFPAWRWGLVARSDSHFDSVLRARELNGFGDTKLEALLRTFGGLPFEEVTPAYYNLHGAAANITALARWDSDKRRYSMNSSGLPGRDPRWRYSLLGDVRNENWDLRNGFTGPAPVLASFNLRREAMSAEISRLVGWRWKWSLGVELSHRDFRSVISAAALTPDLLADGYQLKQSALVDYAVLRSAEHRFDLSTSASSQAGRLWSEGAQSFLKLQASLQARWLPRPRGDDFATFWRAGTGESLGDLPLDELFILGLERDNDPALWMRAHIGTRHGHKGSAPLGREYFVAHWETDKDVYDNGFINIKLAPFLDTGKISDRDAALGSHKWLVDTGAEVTLRVLGVGAAFVYGKDPRSGNNAFYVTLAR